MHHKVCVLTGGVNNILIKATGGFLSCYPMKDHVYNGRNMCFFLRAKKMNFVYSLQFTFV